METIAKFMMEYPFIYLGILYIVVGILVSTIATAIIDDFDAQYKLHTVNLYKYFIILTLFYPIMFIIAIIYFTKKN